LATSSCLFGAAAILFPEQLLQVAAGVSATPLDIAFVRIAGSTMAISAAAEFSLQVGDRTYTEPYHCCWPTHAMQRVVTSCRPGGAQ
jgi:hypothetical protein